MCCSTREVLPRVNWCAVHISKLHQGCCPRQQISRRDADLELIEGGGIGFHSTNKRWRPQFDSTAFHLHNLERSSKEPWQQLLLLLQDHVLGHANNPTIALANYCPWLVSESFHSDRGESESKGEGGGGLSHHLSRSNLVAALEPLTMESSCCCNRGYKRLQ